MGFPSLYEQICRRIDRVREIYPKRSLNPPSGPSGHQDSSKQKTKHGSGHSNDVDKHDKKKEVPASQPGREKKNNRIMRHKQIPV